MALRLVIIFAIAEARMYCEKTKAPLELGKWRYDLKHMDTAVVENSPVSISQGQMYVYENNFPGSIIKYIHVDNLAIRSCGASASIKSGGVGTSNVLIVLHADINQEIRSVVDIWGTSIQSKTTSQSPENSRTTKSNHLQGAFNKVRAVSHNKAY